MIQRHWRLGHASWRLVRRPGGCIGPSLGIPGIQCWVRPAEVCLGLSKDWLGLPSSWLSFPKTGLGLPEAGLGLPEAGMGLSEACLSLPEAGSGLSVAGSGLLDLEASSGLPGAG